ncbi:RING finger protein nhl-1-like [Saccostrea echinata]|uniref:RING finger protein nhl-1-like n=1 Tax=Saccostrea echinata TaxID=191078 RepID=UPI002A831758|nr:RING finger protein nhl-1-like [Saccostrea echinata]
MEDDDVRDVLQTMLASCRSLSPKLAGLIRRFKAVTTLLLMRKDSALSDLDKYTKTLRSWVDDFDEKMRSAIQLAFSEKAAIVRAYKEEVEEELSTLGVLLRESEKLLLTSSNFNATQNKHGKTLVTALKMMKTTGLLETRDVDDNLSCLKLFTQFDCENLPVLGQLITNYSPDKIKQDDVVVNLSSNTSSTTKVNSSENKNIKEKCAITSTSTQTDFVMPEKEGSLESSTVKSKRSKSCQRSNVQRSFIVQENQRFIISQLEKGGISKNTTRSPSVSSVDSETTASVDASVKENKSRRRPVVRSSSLKSDRNQSTQKSVSKTEDWIKDSANNNSKDDINIRTRSPVHGTSFKKNSDRKENLNDNVQANKHLKNKEGFHNPRTMTLSPERAHLFKEVENMPKEDKIGTSARNKDSSNQIQLSPSKSASEGISSSKDEMNQNITENKSYSGKQKSNLTRPKENETQKLELAKQTPTDKKEFSSKSTTSTPVPTENVTVKCEPITPVEVKIKQEPVTPPDLNNNQSMFNIQQRIQGPSIKKSPSVSETETWESDEEIRGKIAEKNSTKDVISDRTQPQENLTEKISPQKDVNCNVIDKEPMPPPPIPPPSLLTTSTRPPSETGALPPSETGVLPPYETGAPSPSETGAPPLPPNEPNSTEKMESNNNEVHVPVSSTADKDLVNGNQNVLNTMGVENNIDCHVSDIPLPKTLEVPKKISTQSVDYKDSVITQHIREELSKGKRGFFSPIRAKLLFKCGTGYNMKFPIGVTTNRFGEIFVADTGNNVIKVFSKEGKPLRSMGISEPVKMRRPSAIVVNAKDEVFVKDDNAVFAFTPQGKFIKALGVNALGNPFGLALTPDGQLVTLDTQRINPRVIILASDGRSRNSFLFAPLLHPQTPPSSKCRFLAIHKDRLIVSDLGCHCVYITDNCGETLFKFGEFGANLGEFREPSGVTTDQQGHMLIGDSKNNRIQIFKPNGTFLCDIKFDQPIQRPSDIHLTKDGKLYVTNFLQHQVFVFQLGQK